MYTTSIKSIDGDEMYQLLQFLYLEYDDDILVADLHMLHYLLVVAPYSEFIQSLLCCFINMEEQIFLSQISCYTFLYLSQPRSLWYCLMERRDMTNELGLFYVIFLTVLLYILWEQLIIVHVSLPTPSHLVPSNFMFILKKLDMNLLNIMILLTIKLIIRDQPTRLKTI